MSLEHFLPQLKNQNVLILSDNSTAVSCIRRQGSLSSKSLRLNQKDTGILSSALHSVSPKTPSRSSKCLGRHKISVNHIINRVVSRPRDIQMDLGISRPVCSGPICQPNQLSSSNIWVPLSRPTSYRSIRSLQREKWESLFLYPPTPLLGEVVALLNQYKGKGVLITPSFAKSG